MSKFEQDLELMERAEIQSLVTKFDEQFDLDAELIYDKDEIEDLFKYMYASMALGDHEKASGVFYALKPILHDFREDIGIEYDAEAEGEDAEGEENGEPEDLESWKKKFAEGLELFTDWCLLALRFTPETKEEFVCLPIYQELFKAYEDAPEEFRYKKGRATLQLVHHYRFWQNSGGDPEVLDDDAFEFLEEAKEYFQEDCDELLAECEEREDWESAVALRKSLYRFYILAGKPNDGIKYLKEAIADLPKLPDYHEADTADEYIDLGKVFLQFKKEKVALKYFTMAKDIYEKSGEEMEMFFYKAEGWIDECKKRMG